MIRIYKVEGDHLKQLDTIHELAPDDTCWINLISPTLEEDNAIENFLKISIPTREDMNEIEPSARLYDEGGAEYMTMSAVSLIQPDNPVKSPVTFILYNKTLVTVHYEEFLSFSIYLQSAKKKNGVTMPTPQGIMFDIIESFINRIADALETAGSEIEGISADIFRSRKISVNRKTGMLQSAIRKIGAKGDLIGMLRESLASISRLLLHHHVETPEMPNKTAKQRLSSLNRDVVSLSDHAGFMSTKMNFLLDATLGVINLEQNQIIKIFSIAAVVFLPPTLVASIYGMNFHFMPELDWKFGYPMAVAIMVISAVLPLAYFKKKGWL